MGLAARRSHRPSQLSGGEQQRVAVARALANGPVMIADEPSGNLDTHTAEQLHDLFFRLRADHVALMVATHNRELRVLQLEGRTDPELLPGVTMMLWRPLRRERSDHPPDADRQQPDEHVSSV